MLELVRSPCSLFSSSTASLTSLYSPSLLGLVPRPVGPPLPPSRGPWVESCIVYRVGGQENRFQVQYGVRGRIRSVRYLQSLSYGSTVPAQVGIRRRISTESYQFGQQYDTSGGSRYPKADRHGVLLVHAVAVRCQRRVRGSRERGSTQSYLARRRIGIRLVGSQGKAVQSLSVQGVSVQCLSVTQGSNSAGSGRTVVRCQRPAV